MVDYVKLQATAARLLAKNGRSITFIAHNVTPGNAAKPWDGPADARATPASTSVQNAVMVEPSSDTQLGLTSMQSDLFKRSEKIFIVSAGTTDLEQFQEILDNGVYWKIDVIQTLQPGSTVVLSFVGVKR